jgi:heme O synthase-like polyprenyltransferase
MPLLVTMDPVMIILVVVVVVCFAATAVSGLSGFGVGLIMTVFITLIIGTKGRINELRDRNASVTRP